MDVAALSDADLRAQLQQYGLNPGPIGPTTRQFYEKKLGMLIDSGGVLPPHDSAEEEEEEEEEEVEDEEVQINYRTAPRTYTEPAPQFVPQKYEPVSQQDYTPVTKARKATVDSQKDDRTIRSSAQRSASQPSKKSSGGSSIAFWIKLLFIIGVAFLVYLVIINMNQSAQDKIPMSHEGV